MRNKIGLASDKITWVNFNLFILSGPRYRKFFFKFIDEISLIRNDKVNVIQKISIESSIQVFVVGLLSVDVF